MSAHISGEHDWKGMLSLLERHDPQKTALRFKGESISYEAISRRSDRLAEAFRKQFPARSLLAFWMPNSTELILAYIAAFKAGMVPMPFAHESRVPEIEAGLRQSRCRYLLATACDGDSLGDGSLPAWVFKLYEDDLSLIAEPGGPGSSPGDPLREGLPEDLTLVLRTSGSNGQPKGVMISQGALCHIVDGRIRCAKIAYESRAVVASSLAHSVGLYQVLAYLVSGASFVLLGSYDMPSLVTAVNEDRPTHIIMVVGAFGRLLKQTDITAGSFSRVAFASVGADRVTQQVQAAYQSLTGRNLSVSYGMTELSWILLNPDPIAAKATALGRPAPGVQVRLVDEKGQEVPDGCLGEILAKGPKAMTGYLYDSDLTSETMADGWVATGDLAYRDDDGFYWFSGRSKEVIVLNSGDLVSPSEVEQAIAVIPGVDQCVVVGMQAEDPDQGEVPWAFIRKADDSLDADDVIAKLQTRLSAYKIPHRVIFVDTIPVGVSGKISRSAMRKHWRDTGSQVVRI